MAKKAMGFYATIPLRVLLNDNLSAKARLLYGVISNLSNQTGYCYASNSYLAEQTGWHEKTISQFVSQLTSSGYLTREDEVTKTGVERRLFLAEGGVVNSLRGVEPNGYDPLRETATQNNISIINKDNNCEAVASDQLFPSDVSDKKPRAREKKAVESCYADFVALWCEAYPLLGFNAISGKKIKEIIKDTRGVLAAKKQVPTDEVLLRSFKYVLDYVKRSNHFVHGKPITTFAGQYRSIMNEITTNGGKEKNRTSAQAGNLNEFFKTIYNIPYSR